MASTIRKTRIWKLAQPAETQHVLIHSPDTLNVGKALNNLECR